LEKLQSQRKLTAEQAGWLAAAKQRLADAQAR
jgi:hypothetical protein